MPYTVGYRYADYVKEQGTTEFATAAEAFAEIEEMQKSGVKIEYVRTPGHGRLSVEAFKLLYSNRR